MASWGSLVQGGIHSVPFRIVIFWDISISVVIRSRSKLKICFRCAWVGDILAPLFGLWGTACAVGAACSCCTSPSTGAHQTKPWFRLSNCLIYPRTLVWEQITSHILWNRFLQHLCVPSKQGGWQNHHHCLISIFWVQSLWKGISSSSLFPPLWNSLIVSGKPSRRERRFSTVGLLWLLWPPQLTSSLRYWCAPVPVHSPRSVPCLCHAISYCPMPNTEGAWS